MEVLKTFGVQPILLAAQVVNFLVLLFLLKKFAYKPILEILVKRREVIAKGLKDAANIEKRLLEIEEEREKKLKQAADEAKGLITDASKAATQLIAEAREKAQTDIAKMIKKSNEQMERERDQMKKEIKAELADLVVLGLEKVAQKTLTTSEQKEMVKQTVQGLK